MPVPVFVRLSYLRHNLGITIREAAQKLDISQSYLFDLEEFKKVGELNLTIKKGKLEEYARFLSNSLNSPLSFNDFELKKIDTLLLTDSFFHSIIRYISNIFFNFPLTPNKKRIIQSTYNEFYKYFMNKIICPAGDNIVYAPNDPPAAEATHYIFTRAFARGSRRRKKQLRLLILLLPKAHCHLLVLENSTMVHFLFVKEFYIHHPKTIQTSGNILFIFYFSFV